MESVPELGPPPSVPLVHDPRTLKRWALPPQSSPPSWQFICTHGKQATGCETRYAHARFEHLPEAHRAAHGRTCGDEPPIPQTTLSRTPAQTQRHEQPQRMRASVAVVTAASSVIIVAKAEEDLLPLPLRTYLSPPQNEEDS